MGDSCDVEKTVNTPNPAIKLDKYRWVIITIYGIYTGINFLQFLQFTIIANITKRYYDVGSVTIDSTGLVFMAAFIVLFIPCGHFIERNTLKTTAVASTGLTVLGNIMKLFAVPQERFYLILLSQTMCGIAQVFMLNIPSKVASVWFGADEVSTACAVGVTWTQIGLALGALIPTQVVPSSTNTEEVADGLRSLFILDNALSIGIFIAVLLFFRSKPESPPSQSQAGKASTTQDQKLEYFVAFTRIIKERDYLLVLICFGITYGLWNSIGILINEMYLHFFPENGKYLGILILIGIISGGVFGTMLFGYILDRTHQFKKVSFVVLTLNCIFWICLSAAFQLRSEIGTCIFLPAFGFSSGSIMVISFEFAIETSYPNPEEFSVGLMNAVIYIFAIFFVIILEFVFEVFGFLAGQIIMMVAYLSCALLILLVSSDLKRRNANLSVVHPNNYGTLIE